MTFFYRQKSQPKDSVVSASLPQEKHPLASSQEELAVIMENVPMAILLIDEQRRVRKANKMAAKFSSFSSATITEHRAGEVLQCASSFNDSGGCGFGPFCQNCSIKKTIGETFVKGTNFKRVEAKLLVMHHGRREELTLLISTSLVNISGERLSLVFIEDITDRKLAESKLEHLASFPRENPSPVLELDSEGEIILYNKATVDILQKIGVKEDASLFLPDDIVQIVGALKQTTENRFFNREVKIKDRIFALSINLIEYLHVIRIYAIDITERKIKEKELVKLNHTHKAISDSTMAITRATDEMQYLNEVCRIITEDCGHAMVWIGFKEADEAKSVRPVACVGFEDGYLETLNITWADSPRGQGPTGMAIRSGQPCTCRNMQTDPKFEPWRAEAIKRGYMSSMVIPLKAENEVIGCISIYSREVDSFSEDETKLLTKLAEDVSYGITALRLKLASQQAEAEKNNFIAIMSHELRNPLTPILAGSQLVLSQLEKLSPDSSSVATSLLGPVRVIEQQAKNMANLLDDLLDITRISRGKIILKKEIINLSDCLKNAIEATQSVMELQKHKVTVSLPNTPIYLRADPLRIEQIVINLLNNSAKYTQSQGRISLEARRNGDNAEIIVRDNGIGIESEKMNSIFDLFSGSDNAFVTTLGELGIGLKLVKDLVSMHHGSIEPKSEGANKGSEFIVNLPAMPESYRPEPVEKIEEAAPVAKQRVLIIDDNRSITQLLSSAISYLGHETKIANDGPSAIILAREYLPQAVLVDIGLPGMNGFEIAHELRKIEADSGCKMRLIAVTGYGQDEDKKKTKDAGFDVHLVKPVGIEILEKTLGDTMS